MWEALEDAGQLTAPFHHAGADVQEHASARMVLKALPFFNAILQGLSQYARSVRGSRGRKRLALTFVGVTSMIISSLLLLWETADEEDRLALLDMDPSMFGANIFLPK